MNHRHLRVAASVLAAGALLLGVAACSGGSSDPKDDSGASTTTEAGPDGGRTVFTDPDAPVNVRSGESFAIRLESNPTTGYSWTVTAVPQATVASLDDPEGTFEEPDSGAMGAPGFQVFDFTAVASGTTEVEFTYARSFDPEDNPTVTTVTITVSA